MPKNVLRYSGLAGGFVTALALLGTQPGNFVTAHEKKVSVKTVEYQGWKNNLQLTNGDVELLITLDIGPRILRYNLPGGKNVFKEVAEQLGKSRETEWVARGGHRLWVGPEDLTRTYAPDNTPIKYSETKSGVLLTQAPDDYGIRKEIEVKLGARGTQVTVVHRLTNVAKEETELAPWVLTMMAPGGVEIIPLPPKRPHPGPPKNAKSPKDYWPNQTMVIWPFTDLKDPRWNLGTKYITLRHDAQRGPTKIGLAHKLSWIGYLNEGTLFIKRIPFEEGKAYPDNGSNFETFSNQEMQEIESLGPMVKLAPEQSVQHTERWELVGGVGDIKDEEDIDKNVLPKIKKD